MGCEGEGVGPGEAHNADAAATGRGGDGGDGVEGRHDFKDDMTKMQAGQREVAVKQALEG